MLSPIHFLIDANLPRDARLPLLAHGQQATDVRDIGLGRAPDARVAAHAQENAMALLTADFDFTDIRNYSPEEYSGIVMIDRPENAPIRLVLKLIEKLFESLNLLPQLKGRLVIVDFARIRVRPPLVDQAEPGVGP